VSDNRNAAILRQALTLRVIKPFFYEADNEGKTADAYLIGDTLIATRVDIEEEYFLCNDPFSDGVIRVDFENAEITGRVNPQEGQ
jgi:hypothetical protein